MNQKAYKAAVEEKTTYAYIGVNDIANPNDFRYNSDNTKLSFSPTWTNDGTSSDCVALHNQGKWEVHQCETSCDHHSICESTTPLINE